MCRRPLPQNLWVLCLHIRDAHIAEGASAAGEDNLLHTALGNSLQALEDGGVLRVDRQHAHAVLLEHGCDDRAAGNQRFLVRQGNVLAGLHRLDGGDEPGTTHDARDHSLGLLVGRHGNLPVYPAEKHRAVVRQGQGLHPSLQFIELGLVASDDLRLELLDLLQKQSHVLTCGQSYGFEEAGVLAADVQGLGANAASRTQDGNLLVLGGVVRAIASVRAHEVPPLGPTGRTGPPPHTTASRPQGGGGDRTSGHGCTCADQRRRRAPIPLTRPRNGRQDGRLSGLPPGCGRRPTHEVGRRPESGRGRRQEGPASRRHG
mmetsp:Transcript_11029/g.23206  ORF Transcript_11029/g.23206 Transcript_11029/m.23206 type:complete len:317 (-) Transcript_11029:82-1032(-)